MYAHLPFLPQPAVEIVQHIKKQIVTKSAPPLKMDYSDYVTKLKKYKFLRAEIKQDQKHVTVLAVDGNTFEVDLPDRVDSVDMLMKSNVHVEVEPDVQDKTNAFISMGAIILIQLALVRSLSGRMLPTKSVVGTLANPSEITTRFIDVAGAHAAKRDLIEIIDFLKHPETYKALGAKVPRGILLTGSPGCGKTLLARATAGEANVPFFACSASEFVQMFVGVGADRIRTLFQNAEKVGPAIIFIDEIDSVGKQRSNTTQNEEREHTLNQLLVCMDGFSSSSKVVVLAATNRPQLLDEALVRPGRFDKIIEIPKPDVIDRKAILQVHCRGKPLASDVDLAIIARNTPGMSGASLQTLSNEAALVAARLKQNQITMTDWNTALDKILLGEINEHQKSMDVMSTYAYHEAGHAIMALLVSDFDTLRMVSIVGRGRTGGVTLFEPREDGLYTREYLENHIKVGLGGRAAEEIIFGTNKITSGAQGDLEQVTKIARTMIKEYGFGTNIGECALEGMYGDGRISYDMMNMIDTYYNETLRLLKQNVIYLHKLAHALKCQETLTMDEVRNVVYGIKLDYHT
jgi:cell division protease FtsH